MKIAKKQLENGKYVLKIKYDMFILDRNVFLGYTTIVLYLTAFTRFVLLPSWEFTGYLTLPQAINYRHMPTGV